MIQAGRTTKNLYLSQSDQRHYMRLLRKASESGDINAMGWMVFLSKNTSNSPFYGTGSFQSGWVGDKTDPKQEILKNIRNNDPTSHQLPENKGL